MDNPVSEEVKEERYHRFIQLQAGISRNRLTQKIGSVQTVLVDEVNSEQVIARSKSDAPEIDGLVYLPVSKDIKVGDLLNVIVTDSDDYDLYAEPVI